MSLDKFLSGKPPKKKKKSNKSSKPPLKASPPIKVVIPEASEEKHTPIEPSSPQDTVPEPAPVSDSPKPVLPTTPAEPISNDVDDTIFIEGFKNKSKSDLVEIIQDIIHSSPSYPRNKNLLAQLVADQKGDLNPEILAEQLEISYYEVVVLLDEIKKDFP